MTTLSQPSPPSVDPGPSSQDTGPDGSEPIVGPAGIDPVDVGRPGAIRTLLRSDELSCPSCVAKIEKRLGRLPGVYAATVHFATGRIEVEYDPGRLGVRDLIEVVAKAGYRARPAAW